MKRAKKHIILLSGLMIAGISLVSIDLEKTNPFQMEFQKQDINQISLKTIENNFVKNFIQVIK